MVAPTFDLAAIEARAGMPGNHGYLHRTTRAKVLSAAFGASRAGAALKAKTIKSVQ